MHNRAFLGALLLMGPLFSLTSCSNNPELNSITVNPGSVTTTPSAGLRVDFTAIGSYTRPGHEPITKDITDTVTWTSASPQFVSIGTNTGVATVTGYGTGNIDVYAAAPGFHGDVVGSAVFNISNPTTTGSVRSVALIPAQGSTSENVQFTAVGRTEEGDQIELTKPLTWYSTDSDVATIDQKTGLLKTLGPGKTTIVAVYTDLNGTNVVGKIRYNVER
jgi:hypothetical protein